MARKKRRHYRRRSRWGLGALGEYPPETNPSTVTFNGRPFRCHAAPLKRGRKLLLPSEMKKVVCVAADRYNFVSDADLNYLRTNIPDRTFLRMEYQALKNRIAEAKRTAWQRMTAARRAARRAATAPPGVFVPTIGPLPLSVAVRAGYRPRGGGRRVRGGTVRTPARNARGQFTRRRP